MIRNLIVLFGVVVAIALGLAAYHLASVNSLPEQPVPIFHWEDKSGTATVEQVRRVGSFVKARQRRFSVGYTESVHWLRFRLVADSLPLELSFDVRNHTIDRLELFEVQNEIVTSLGKTGTRFPFRQRPSPTKTFVYLLNVAAGQSADYYLRLDKRYENLATELTLWQTSDYEDKEEREYLLWGLFSGVAGLVALLAFLFFAATRDPVYGWYGLYILFLALRQYADTGLGFQYLWPQLPALNQPDVLIQSIWLYTPAMLQFQQYFLQLRTESRPVFWATQGLKLAFWGLFAGLVICQIIGLTETNTGANRLIRQLHTALANGAFLTFVAVIVVGLRSPDAVKRVYATGLAVQTLGQAFVVVQTLLGNQANGLFFVDAYMILIVNFFIDLVAFAYLLSYRYRKSVDEERQLQLSLARTQQYTNEAIIDVLESERQQVGQLILTDVGGRLADTRAILSALPPAPLLTDAADLIGKTDAALDQILRNSLPSDLTQKGLATALADLVQRCCRTETIQLSFNYEPDTQQVPNHAVGLSAGQTRQLYRITSELITNILKHANATEGHVVLLQTSGGWQLTVSDNGQGFDASHAQAVGGIGLKNLYARAETLDATVELDSGPGGTTVSLFIAEENTNKFVF